MAKRFPSMMVPDATKKFRPDEGKGKRQFEDLRPDLQALVDDTLVKINMTRADLDNCVYESLCDFPDPVQDEIVLAFGQADLSTIRNKTGYFIGILKEYRRHGKALSQGNTADGGAPMPPRVERVKTGSVASLPLMTQHRFREMFSRGLVHEHELDKSIFDSMGDFDERTQAAIIERFSNADFATLKNKTGYFISILKQAREARKNGLPFGNSGVIPEPAFVAPLYDSYGNYNYHSSFAPPPPAPRPMHPGYADPYAPYPPEQRTMRHDYSGFGYGAPPPPISVPEGVPHSFYKICPNAQVIMGDMYNSRLLQPSDLDECVFDSLATFGDNEQCVMCEGFAQAGLAKVRNRTAFFIGILKKHRQGVR
jgi:hypothetical protein